MPSVRFLLGKGIHPKGFEAFDAHETQANIKQQVSNFPRQEDGERPSLNHHPTPPMPKFFPPSFWEGKMGSTVVPNAFTPRDKAETNLQDPDRDRAALRWSSLKQKAFLSSFNPQSTKPLWPTEAPSRDHGVGNACGAAPSRFESVARHRAKRHFKTHAGSLWILALQLLGCSFISGDTSSALCFFTAGTTYCKRATAGERNNSSLRKEGRT